MCGIVGGVTKGDVVPMLIEGLRRLEYRGYDSCGIAVHNGHLQRARSTSRVADLALQLQAHPMSSPTGIAHTRWATHGAPEVHNAHPHFSCGPQSSGQRSGRVALVHNGIIENHDELRPALQAQGYVFEGQTDTEVVAHLLDSLYAGDIFAALRQAVTQLRGAYALAVFHKDDPARIVGARAGCPLVLGIGPGGVEHFLASDAVALAGVSDQIVYLEEGDVVDLQLGRYAITDSQGRAFDPTQRPVKTVHASSAAAELGPYQHYMQKEIFEQPRAIADTLEGLQGITPDLFGQEAGASFERINKVLILACGTSYYAACVAKYWLEDIAQIATAVEVASEYRYRRSVPDPDTLVVAITQSGETADTLAAVRHAQSLGMVHTLTICNVQASAMVRQCALAYITRAGIEIGVASTKAFTTQLAALFLLTLTLAKTRHRLSPEQERSHLQAMRHLPTALQSVLALEPQVMVWAEHFGRKDNALFLGRGLHYPIALEGALKLKEISYIHAEAYPAGELKHGPLALVTRAMPVVTVAPNDAMLNKLKSNMEEVRARGGVLYVLADADTHISASADMHVIHMPEHYGALSPILHVVPLQLLAYHTARAKGTDVDKPRNLAKSVTVE